MKTAIINIKVGEKDKKQAQKLASDLGFSLSSIMNAFLKEFLRKKQVNVSLKMGEPSDWAKKEISASEKDYQEGRYIEFKNWEDEESWLDSIISDAEKKSNS